MRSAIDKMEDTLRARMAAGTRLAEAEVPDEFAMELLERASAFMRGRVPLDDVDDTVQEAAFRVWRNLHRWQDKGRLLGWIVTVFRHTVADLYRGGQYQRDKLNEQWDEAEVEGEEVSPPLHHTAEASHETNIDHARLMACYRDAFERFSELHPQMAELIQLYDIDGLKASELAAIYETAETAIRKRCEYARRKFSPFAAACRVYLQEGA